MAQRPRPARLAAGLTAAYLLLLTFAAGPAEAAPAAVAAGPLPCLAPASSTLVDEGAVLKWNLATYHATTTGNFWSVVATRGSQGYDSDIALFDTGGCAFGESRRGGFTPTDWIAFDNNSGRLPVGTYATRVFAHPGNTSPVKYLVQFVPGRRTLSTSTPAVAQPVGDAYASWLVDVRDVYLSSSASYTFTATGGVDAVYLVGSSVSAPSSWSKTSATADAGLELPASPDPYASRTAVLPFRPASSGWYGAVFVRSSQVGPPVTVQVRQS